MHTLKVKQKNMCWFGKNVPRVADKDIEVFKVVSKDEFGDFRSYYFDMCRWALNEKKEAEFRITESYFHSDMVYIYEGLHSFITPSVQVIYENILNKFASCERERLCKMTCIIPKGATYYINEFWECVSNSLIPTKFEPLKDLIII